MADRIRVALVAHGVHDHGGMERAFYELVRRGSETVDFVVLSAELAPELRPLVEWKRIVVPPRPIPLKTVLFAAVAAARLRRTPRDLVHTLGAIVPPPLDLATVQFCSAGFHAATGRFAPPQSPPLRRLNTTLARLVALGLERWAYRPGNARAFGAVSTGIGRELRLHYPGIEVSLTPNAVDSDRFRPDAATRASLRTELGVEDATFVALFVGGDWDRKGLELAIDGLARAAVPASELWVVGRGDKARFAARARAAGVGARVRFVGPRHDTERWYAAADAFVFPTLYEAAPLVAYEAAAAGLPLIATRANGVEDLLGDDEAGISVTRDAESIADAIRQLAGDDELRSRLGDEARARASRHDWDSSVNAVLTLYDELALPRNGARP